MNEEEWKKLTTEKTEPILTLKLTENLRLVIEDLNGSIQVFHPFSVKRIELFNDAEK